MLKKFAILMVLLVVLEMLEACHSGHIHKKYKKRQCRGKKKHGKICYFYEDTHHEHSSGSKDSHEKGHPNGSDESDEVKTSSEEREEYGSCSDDCKAFELDISLCPVDEDCPDDEKLVKKDSKKGCTELKCEDGYAMGVLGSNGELDSSAYKLHCANKEWYNSDEISFGKTAKILCYKL